MQPIVTDPQHPMREWLLNTSVPPTTEVSKPVLVAEATESLRVADWLSKVWTDALAGDDREPFDYVTAQRAAGAGSQLIGFAADTALPDATYQVLIDHLRSERTEAPWPLWPLRPVTAPDVFSRPRNAELETVEGRRLLRLRRAWLAQRDVASVSAAVLVSAMKRDSTLTSRVVADIGQRPTAMMLLARCWLSVERLQALMGVRNGPAVASGDVPREILDVAMPALLAEADGFPEMKTFRSDGLEDHRAAVIELLGLSRRDDARDRLWDVARFGRGAKGPSVALAVLANVTPGDVEVIEALLLQLESRNEEIFDAARRSIRAINTALRSPGSSVSTADADAIIDRAVERMIVMLEREKSEWKVMHLVNLLHDLRPADPRVVKLRAELAPGKRR